MTDRPLTTTFFVFKFVSITWGVRLRVGIQDLIIDKITISLYFFKANYGAITALEAIMSDSNRKPEYRDLPFSRGRTVRLLVVSTCHPGVLISAGENKDPFIKHGAVLISRGLHWTAFNGGYYSAVLALAAHIPGSHNREKSEIMVAKDLLDEAVRITWSTDSSSPQGQKDRYELLMRSLIKWRRPRSKTKRKAMAVVEAGSTLWNRHGKFSPTSRSPMVLSASRYLCLRCDEMVRIDDDRHSRLAALIIEKNRTWKFVDGLERMLLQTKTRWRDGRPPPRKVAKGHAGHYRDAVKFLGEPYVAPFGRRTLRRLQGDFERIAEALETERYDKAFEFIGMSLNSIYMVRVRADMEDALLKLTQLVDSEEDKFASGEQGDFYVALYGFRMSFEKPGLEDGFKNPVLPKVLAYLDQAIAEVKKPDPDLQLLRGYLKQACEPI